MLKIGFTGTRNGMSSNQIKEFEKLFKSKDFEEFHHGVCIGSDKQAHDHITSIKNEKNAKTVGHPPKYKKFMAECECDYVMKPYDYLQRNKNIVDETDVMVATPDTKERVRSGTWSTIRYARKQGKKIYIIHKNGRVTIE